MVAGAATGAVDRDHMVPEDPDGPYVFQFSKTVVQTKFFFKFKLIRMTCMGNLESRSSDTLILAAGPGGRSSNRCGTGDDLEMVLDHAAERHEGRPRTAVRHDEVKGRQYEGHLLVV